MERKYVKYYQGIKVDVVEARADSNMHVQISVLGDPSFTKKPFREFRDTELESQGYIKLAMSNGSLFFTQNGESFANGVEKSMGVLCENDDSTWDNNLGFWHGNGLPYIHTQEYIKTIINSPKVRGAITAAFGLINNGRMDIRGARYYKNAAGKWIKEPSRAIYLAKSGRTIIGKKADGTMIMAVFDGVTGKSGLTGYQTYLLAKQLGLRNAVCMDGGGSTYLEYKGQIYNNSSREGTNAIAIYIKYL